MNAEQITSGFSSGNCPLINTLLQQSAARCADLGTASAVWRVAVKPVETVRRLDPPVRTPLKQGVHERVALRACNLQNPRASRSEPMRADANRPQVLGSWAPSLAVFCVCALSPLGAAPAAAESRRLLPAVRASAPPVIDRDLAMRDGGDATEESESRVPKSERRPKPEFQRRNLAVSVRISDFELRISRAVGVVAERAFVAERLARGNAAFDDEGGVDGDLASSV